MGYTSLGTARPGLDAPLLPYHLKLDTPVTISFTGFIGVSSRVLGFHKGAAIELGLLAPITIGSVVVHRFVVLVSEVRWVDGQGYVVELNGDTQITVLPGGSW